MAKYIGAKCRLSRRERTDLELKSGIKPIESKCKLEQLPGQHWGRHGRDTDYGAQLRMKQMIKRYYGLLEKQFRGCYEKADRLRGSTAGNLMKLLESRLDNIVYRLGFASTRAEARQLVNHKAILVNGIVVSIPSYFVKKGDVVEVREKAKKQLRVNAALDLAQQKEQVSWLELNATDKSGLVKSDIDVTELPALFKVNLVVELYSK